MRVKIGFRRLISMLMCLVLVVGMLPASALATEASPAEVSAVTEPVAEKSTAVTPATEAPATEAPAVEEPAVEEPAAEEPAEEKPAAEEPAAEEPAAEEPAEEEPAAEEPAEEKPAAEEPAEEEPAAEEPAEEEPAAEEPAEEEPAAEEPAEEEPTAEELTEEESEEEAPAAMAVSGSILWVNREAQAEEARPASVTLTLHANGEAVGTIEVPNPGSDTEWPYTFGEQAVQDTEGNVIAYTVEAAALTDYAISYDGLTVTATYALTEEDGIASAEEETITTEEEAAPAEEEAVEQTYIDLSGNVIWVNRDQQASASRPTSVTLTLYANGVATDNAITVTGSGTTWPFTFTDLPALDENGTAIEYTVVETAVSGYEITYSFDTLTITNSYLGGDSWEDHTFNHIDVRINGATLEIQHVLKDANGVVISRRAETITAYVTNVDYVTLDGTTYTGFTQSGTYEFRKMGLRIDLSSSSTVTMQVDLVDNDGNVYNNVTITYGMGGIMDAAYECDGYRNRRFDGLDFVVGAAQNYVIEFVSYGLGVDVQKNISVNGAVSAFTGSGGEFSFLLTEVETGRTWTVTNDASGTASFAITYPYSTEEELEAYNGKTYTYTLQELSGSSQYTNDTTVHTFTVTLSVTTEGYVTTLMPVVNGGSSASYSFTNILETVSVSGSKTWEDGNDRDGIRPEYILINLLANGTPIQTATVTAADGWAWEFTDLPKYDSNHNEIAYTISEEAVEGYESAVDGYNVTNTHTVETVDIPVEKIWDDADNQDGKRPTSITVHLLANGEPTGDTLTITAATGWTGTFEGLPKYEAGVEIVYTVSEETVAGYTTSYNGTAITNIHIPETVDISGTKTWVDADNQDGKRPASITINLVANGEIIDTIIVTEADGWAWSFTALPKYAAGELITYSVTETAVGGYTTTYNGYNVTNTHTPEKTSVTVTKAWVDSNDQDGIRPNDITIALLADGEDTGKTLVLSEGNSWTGSFTDLDVYANGEIITYTVQEISVTGYTTVITGDQTTGYTVTNSHTPETVAVEGTKTWVDADNQDGFRPASITIHLLKNGEVIDTVTVTESDGWAWSFENLPKYEDHGSLITYSVTEEAVEDYSATYNGYNVTNTHTPEKTSVTVTKAWVDSNDQDGIRPEDIVVKLLADGEDTGKTLVLSEGNSWTDSFTELDKYADGEIITYTVQEISVTGYTTVITGTVTDGYTITNSHTPEVVEISGSKTWNDADNQDGKRPESITINLLKNGEVIDTITVTEADGWSWSFDNLPKYEAHGTLINYSITEEAVEDYSTTYNGFNVINTHTPEKTSVTVAKSWQDSNDQDGIRPESITVILLADGGDTGKRLILSEDNNWTGSFAELDKYADGEIITYTVQEISVTGYTTVITGTVTDGYTIANSHTPEVVEISGSKTWDDADNQDGKRPASITIRLHADGVEIDAVTVTEADGWAWSFGNLPKYADGVEIEYVITEDAVEGYTATYNGFDVTNKYTPKEISITVVKAWADKKNAEGKRPDEVTIILLANGEDTGKRLILSEDNNWVGSFTGLPKYAEGQLIEYTIDEVKVTGYNTVIRGSVETGFTVTNSRSGIPTTGDERMPMLWIGLMMASLFSFTCAVVPAGKKKRR